MNPMTIRGTHLKGPACERICRWLNANHINPNRVPIDSLIIVTGNHVKVHEMQDQQRRLGGRSMIIERDGDGELVIPVRWKTYRLRYDLKDIK